MGFFDNDLSDSEEFFILEEYDEQLKREQAELDAMLEGHDSLLYDEDEYDDDHFFDDRDDDDNDDNDDDDHFFSGAGIIEHYNKGSEIENKDNGYYQRYDNNRLSPAYRSIALKNQYDRIKYNPYYIFDSQHTPPVNKRFPLTLSADSCPSPTPPDDVLSPPTPSAHAPDNSINAPTPDEAPDIINTPKDAKQIMKERTRPLAIAFGVPLIIYLIIVMTGDYADEIITIIVMLFFVRFLIKRSR